jgi:hypothetical protein
MKYILVSIGILLSNIAVAQQAFTNSGNLQVHTGGSISGFGDFINTSTAVIVNNGSLYLKRNVTNNEASIAAGTGTLYLNGTSTQAIGGTSAFKTYNLSSDNTTGITLNSNLHVSGAHTFVNGVITPAATPNYLVYEAGSSHSGSGDTRHVNGWVKKVGTTNFTFPVGNGTVLRNVALSSLSVSGEFNAKYFANTPNSMSMVSPVWDVNEPEYWSINKISGGNAIVTLNWNYSKVYFPNWIVNDIMVAGYNGSAWINNGGVGTASGTAATTGSVTGTSISSFNLFTFGSRTYILPLTLVSFTAARDGDYTKLDWKTTSEYNMSRFVVERSDDNINFYSIGEIAARNSLQLENYSSRDSRPIYGTAYYRLRCIDNTSKVKYSEVIPITVNHSGDLLTLVLNPVNDRILLVAGQGLKGVYDYNLNSMNGQLVQKGKLTIQNGGQQTIALDPKTKAGTYLLAVNNATRHFVFKVIKK